ncbi:hypothetical protein TIFTF001_007733 [Ficus carica]|uniref:Uncharacterized protein n=1 Tax=Ficus carica TaxID=3494 RepID=A0AA87ZQU3_FICCA|nr:hypothetical protein TIFTF001_007733 [Ficus carica]
MVAEMEKEKKIFQLRVRIPLHNFGEMPKSGKKKHSTYEAVDRSPVSPVSDQIEDQNPIMPVPVQPLEDALPTKKSKLGAETLTQRLRLRVPSEVVKEKKGWSEDDGHGCERRLRPAKKEKVRFQAELTKQEVDEDFQKIYASGLRPKRRLKNVHKPLINNRLFPAMMIRELSADTYKVRLPP